MRTRRILAVLATVLAAGMLSTSTAQAGGWAETVLDPPPAKIESKVTYTFGFWVLQHGSYPFKGGDLGEVALRATDEDGNVVTFPATNGPTEGHFFAEVVFPHDSVWQLGSVHQMLMSDANVALVTVPGEVRISPSDVKQRAHHDWGAVRPSFPPTADDAQIAAPLDYPDQTKTVRPLVEPRNTENAAAAVDEPGGNLPVELVVAAGLATVALAIWLGRRHARGDQRRVG